MVLMVDYSMSHQSSSMIPASGSWHNAACYWETKFLYNRNL